MIVRILAKYLGGNYAGSQRQLNAPAVQNKIDDALSLVYHRAVRTIASGRTDRGVHADEQVFTFQGEEKKFSLAKLPAILNHKLPEDIRVLSCEKASPGFHARFSARVRMYRYQILDGAFDAPPTLLNAHLSAYAVGFPVDEAKLLRYLEPLVGIHDFSSFCSVKDTSRIKHREIFKIQVWRNKDLVNVDFYGNAFLRNMIRSIMGNLLNAYMLKKDAGILAELLEKKDPSFAKKRAPAKGLILKKIFYSPIFGPRDYYPAARTA